MKLENALLKKLDIEDVIFNSQGELTELTEIEYDLAVQEVEKNVDKVVFVVKAKKQEILDAKSLLKNFIDVRTRQLDQFKGILLQSVKKFGVIKNNKPPRLETPLSLLSVKNTKTKTVVILDFDAVMKSHPTAVKISTFDNKRTISLDKKDLKDIWDKGEGATGFMVNEGISESLNCNVRVRKNAIK